MHIGVYEGHAFLIKDINKVTNNYTCGDCMVRFTKSCDLTCHASRCTRGQTHIECPGNRILAPESAFEKAFYPECGFGIKATCWLEYVSRESCKHIHHHRCGHGGERFIKGAPVDGYHPEPKLSFSSMVATGTVVSSASRTPNKEKKLSALTKTAKKQLDKLPI